VASCYSRTSLLGTFEHSLRGAEQGMDASLHRRAHAVLILFRDFEVAANPFGPGNGFAGVAERGVGLASATRLYRRRCAREAE